MNSSVIPPLCARAILHSLRTSKESPQPQPAVTSGARLHLNINGQKRKSMPPEIDLRQHGRGKRENKTSAQADLPGNPHSASAKREKVSVWIRQLGRKRMEAMLL